MDDAGSSGSLWDGKLASQSFLQTQLEDLSSTSQQFGEFLSLQSISFCLNELTWILVICKELWPITYQVNFRPALVRLHFHLSLSCIGEGMATHSSVLAWRIPGTGEPAGLPSMGLHRVGHNWIDLAAVIYYYTIYYFKMQCLKTVHMFYFISSLCQEYEHSLCGSSDSGLHSSYWPKSLRSHLKA